MTYHSVGSHGLKREKNERTTWQITRHESDDFENFIMRRLHTINESDRYIKTIFAVDDDELHWLMFDTNNATDLDVVLTQCLIYTFPLVKSKSVKNCLWITTVTHKKREKKKKVLLFLSFNVVSTFNVRSNFLHSVKMKRFLNDIGYDIHPWANLLDSVSSVKVKPQSLQW